MESYPSFLCPQLGLLIFFSELTLFYTTLQRQGNSLLVDKFYTLMKPTQILMALAAIAYAAPALEQTMAPPLAGLDTHFQPHAKRCDKKGPPPYYGEHPYPNQTYNQLTDGTPCRNFTMIYARGMGGKGNVGEVNGVGPAIFNRLATIIGGPQNLAVAGVKYKANMKTVIQKAPREGGRAMSELINRAATQCPDTKIVIMGHSAGGALVHQAAENITTEVTAHIAAAVTLGYKKRGRIGKIPKSRILVVCRKGDSFCSKTVPWEPFVFGCPIWFYKIVKSHQNYQKNANATAEWIAGRLIGTASG